MSRPVQNVSVPLGEMYESLESIRQAARERLNEIERELKAYEELLVERDLLREVLALPPLRGGADGSGRVRARRGENIDRIVTFVADHPGATVGDIAQQTGITKGVVYNTVRVLVDRGQLEPAPERDGVRAYRVAAAADVR